MLGLKEFYLFKMVIPKPVTHYSIVPIFHYSRQMELRKGYKII